MSLALRGRMLRLTDGTSLRVLRSGDGPDALRVRFPRLTPHAKAAILRIDPLQDREEYTALLHLLDSFSYAVLSQCDNLALLPMNSPSDLAELREVFGFAPPAMLAASPVFRQGEMLLAGGFVPAPIVAPVGARRTQEGGSDVSVPLRPTS